VSKQLGIFLVVLSSIEFVNYLGYIECSEKLCLEQSGHVEIQGWGWVGVISYMARVSDLIIFSSFVVDPSGIAIPTPETLQRCEG
jgi:hypothetical protein